jgi:hypothetical protein
MKIRKLMAAMFVMALSIGFTACDDGEEDNDNPTTPTTADGITFTQTGSLELNITHVFGDSSFDLSPASYITAAQDTIRVSQLSYYVSNIVLTNVNGSKVALPGYFLEDFLPGKPNTITLQNVPAGTYKNISYLIGVDSLANSTGSHTGDLDPSYGMYWTWNTGYVFVRLKGRYAAANNSYSFDIGGTENGMGISHNLLSYKISGTKVKAALKFDLEKVFNAPNIYDLKTDPNDIHSTTSAGIEKFTANIKNAFSLTGVQ